jgi:hypothetical protein
VRAILLIGTEEAYGELKKGPTSGMPILDAPGC